jgi:hypothetical protein
VRGESQASGAVPRQSAPPPRFGSRPPWPRPAAAGRLAAVGAHEPSISSARTSETFSVPANKSVRLHHHQDLTPFDQRRQADERDPCRILGTPRLDPPFHIQRELFSQKQILSGELSMGSQPERNKPQDVDGDAHGGADGSTATGLWHVGDRTRRGPCPDAEPTSKSATIPIGRNYCGSQRSLPTCSRQ